jgi:hypothetical protein
MTSDANSPNPPTQKSVSGTAKPSWLQRRILSGNRLHKWLIVLLAAGCLGLYVWHMVSTSQLRDTLAEERAALKTQAEGMVGAQTQASLRVTGLAMSWAATQSMQREELSLIDTHITRMVKEGPVKLIAVLDGTGQVRVSTNKKLEGRPGSAEFPGAPLTATELTVVEHGGGLLVVAPLEYALGTVVMVYDKPVLPTAPPAAPATTPPGAPARPAVPASAQKTP